jgi:hypothetical protein
MAERRSTPPFDRETLRLFLALEGVSRDDPDFKATSLALARRLDLTDEWWMMKHVNDRSRGPCHPVGYAARDAWYKCREVRHQLLAALAATSNRAQ